MSDRPRDVLIIDYGVGNHRSVGAALLRLGYSYDVSSDAEALRRAHAYILPGVGAFQEAMKNLESRGINEVLRQQVLERKKPLLGICLGMQVLAEDSTEGGMRRGLGFIPGHVVRIPEYEGVRIPHVGWNEVEVCTQDPLFVSVGTGTRFYFDHSYHFATEEAYRSATTMYGEALTAAVQCDNIFGVQFHPEKSQTAGLRLLRAFLNYAKISHANHAL